MASETAFIGFGSNAGDRLDHCRRAVTLLNLLPATRLTGASSLYETEPIQDPCDPGPNWFINGVVRIETEIAPRRLLEVCQEVERALGRDPVQRSGARPLDLDILFYGQHVIQEPGLTIPHPRLHTRRFVLEPLAELEATWQHPLLHRTVGALLTSITDSTRVRRLDHIPAPQPTAPGSCSTPPSDPS